MTRKHTMTAHEHEIYTKAHHYDDALAEEEGKIAREVASYQGLSRKGDEQVKRKLQELIDSGGSAAWEDEPALDEDAQRAVRERRNAKTHKRRLKGLELHEGSG